MGKDKQREATTGTGSSTPSSSSPRASSSAVATLTDEADRSPADGPALEAGATVGRYRIVERVGAGAMGEVFAALDPKLERKVALKLVQGGRARSETARVRLVREAQAMARLSHPNVVTIVDVGVWREQVFLAMEFIDGQTLRQWVKQAEPTRVQILAALSDVARGLAAAHEQGLVHRDLKPDNIMVTGCGPTRRVVVTDFGLARPSDEAAEAEAESADLASASLGIASGSLTDLTRTGALLGTPRYMAPELFAGQPASPASDQFGLGVTAYEALYGGTPFSGLDLGELIANLLAPPRRPSECPRDNSWPWRVVKKMLAVEPAQRFEHLEAVAEALTDDSRQSTRTLLVGGLVLTTGVAAAAWGLGMFDEHDQDPCASSVAALEGIWDDTRRAELRSSATGSSDDSFAAFIDKVDAYAQTFAASHRDACEATRVRGEQPESMFDRRMRCLASARSGLGALLQHVGATPAGDDLNLDVIAGALPAVAPCDDVERLRLLRPPPEDAAIRARVDALSAEVARAVALSEIGSFDAAETILQGARERVAEVDYALLTCETLNAAGRIEALVGRPERGAQQLEEAALTCRAGGDVLGEARAWADATFVYGAMLQEPKPGLAAARHAEAAVAAMGDRAPVGIAVRLENALAVLYTKSGEFAEAERHLQALLRQPIEVDDEAVIRSNIVDLLIDQERFDEALGHWYVVAEMQAGTRAVTPGSHARHGGQLAHLRILLGLGRTHEAEAVRRVALAEVESVTEPGDLRRDSFELARLWILAAEDRWGEIIDVGTVMLQRPLSPQRHEGRKEIEDLVAQGQRQLTPLAE